MNRLPARSSDPLTSWAAAEHIESTGKGAKQRAIAVAAVHAHPGLTSHELARHCELDRYQLARRLPEASEVEPGETRKCSVTGHAAQTWWPAAEKVAA